MNLQPDKLIAVCHDCELTVTISSLRYGEKATCPRCGYIITRKFRNAATSISVYSLTAIISLFFANFFTFIELSAQGQERSLTLYQSIKFLFSEGEWILGLIVLFFILVLPLLFAVVLNTLLFSVSIRRASLRLFYLLKLVKIFQQWNMAEIYFLAVLVSIVKLVALADIFLGPSFWFFAAFCVAQLAAMQKIDCFQLSRSIREMIPAQADYVQLGEYVERASSCAHCGSVHYTGNSSCSMCGADLRHRMVNGFQRSWLYLITGVLLYIPANVLPIMITTTLGRSESSTIVEGVLLLWSHGSYPIAMVIFVASVAVPIGKFLVLLVLLIGQQFKLFRQPRAQIAAYRAIELVGRWSMVDVFVVAFLAALIQIGSLMTIRPGPAILAFAGMVVVTMLAAENFETKYFWEENGK